MRSFEGEPEEVLNPKKKIWEKIAPDLKTSAGLFISWVSCYYIFAVSYTCPSLPRALL